MPIKKYFYPFILLIFIYNTYAKKQIINADYAIFFAGKKEEMENSLYNMIERQKNENANIKNIVLLSEKKKIDANTVYTIAQELKKKKKTLTRFIERSGKKKSTQLDESDLWKYIWDMKISRKIKKKIFT